MPLLDVFKIEAIETPDDDPDMVILFQNELLPLLEKNMLILLRLQPFESVHVTLKLELYESKLPDEIL